MNAPVNKPPEMASFLHLPVVSNWHGLDADAVIFGAAFGKPYRPANFPNDQSSAPAALRAASGRVLLNDQALDLAYCGAGCSVTVEVAGESFDGSVKTGAVFDDTARRMRPQKA